MTPFREHTAQLIGGNLMIARPATPHGRGADGTAARCMVIDILDGATGRPAGPREGNLRDGVIPDR